MSIACYVRVSTVGQTEASQRHELERWLKNHRNREKVVWFVDKRSGDDLKRPAFEELQAAVFAGEVKTIVVFKLDRISRSLADGINTLVGWCKAGVRVVSVTQQLDFAGPAGQLIAAVLFAVAQMEQETRRERQAAGIAAAKASGRRFGRRKGETIIDSGKVRRLKAQGHSASAVAGIMNISRRSVFNHLRA
jgi:DNA invertase Pin-like site-specific DNA recombinase